MEGDTKLEEENKRLKAQIDNLERKKKEKWSKRYQFSKKLSAKFLGAKLKNAINNFFTELQEKKTVSRDTVSDLLAALFIRITRVGVFLLITSLLPTLLILLQVYYLKNQNKLINGQNNRMKQQTFLQEADRRGYMIGVLDRIITDVSSSGGLSRSGKARLIAISKILKPYHYLDGDQLTERALSPERGYLLLALLESNIDLDVVIDQNTNESLGQSINFNYAELRDASLTALNIKDINLDYSDLQGSNFKKSLLKGRKSYSKKGGKPTHEYLSFRNAYLQSIIFDLCELAFCNFSNSNLFNSSFTNSSLEEIIFENANLENSNFSNCDFYKNVNFTNANIFNANFDNATVDTNFMKRMKDQLPKKSFDYLEDSYHLKIKNKRGLLIRNK